MSSNNARAILESRLKDAGIELVGFEERTFPGEHWIIALVDPKHLVVAQSLVNEIEKATTAEQVRGDDGELVVIFRPSAGAPKESAPSTRQRGRLYDESVDHLVQLLEARSRTSDALPSLMYVEDPRASLSAIAASRHQVIFGRRGVGKTALLLEAKRTAESSGHAAAWLNMHAYRALSADAIFVAIATEALEAIVHIGGASAGASFQFVRDKASELHRLGMKVNGPSERQVNELLPSLNRVLRSVLREDLVRLYIFLDDFYLLPKQVQPRLLDLLAGMLRDCNGWLKIASIERLTRLYEASTRTGLEVPHDVSKVDLDVTLEDPSTTQVFLENVLRNYLSSAGVGGLSKIAKPEARGRLVLASGGVPRDYLSLFGSSIVIARSSRELAREIGKEDVAQAAGNSARVKLRDLDQDISSNNTGDILTALEIVGDSVRGAGYSYFRIDLSHRKRPEYDLFGQLVDLRFAHLVLAQFSDQHRAGVRYEGYVLDLSQISDVRLKRGLNVLDFEQGQWTWKETGKARASRTLSGTGFRDELRRSPLVDLDTLSQLVD